MGKRGVDNGTHIDASSEIQAAQWDPNTKSLVINVDNFDSLSLAEKAGEIGHELTHEIQDRAGLITPQTTLSIERNAYRNQGVIERTFGKTPFWDDHSGGPNYSRINSMARISCMEDVKQDQWYLCH
jgi:hypothetical protein